MIDVDFEAYFIVDMLHNSYHYIVFKTGVVENSRYTEIF
jgi:hypothetical protein